jgi:hypothetical protein
VTLTIAWVRHVGITPELIFASDSRLTGGGNVDHCQKVFSLPREDCCIAFAGCTTVAYPFILQLQNVISGYKKLFDRAIDVTRLCGIVISLLNRFIKSHEGTVDGDFEKDLLITSFIFGGWSWKFQRFFIWRIQFEKVSGKYISISARRDAGAMKSPAHILPELQYIGDYTWQFAQRLERKLMKPVPVPSSEAAKWDYEPLVVLSEMLSEKEFTDRSKPLKGLIGGGPQMAKVYPFSRTLHYAVEWDVGTKFVYVIKGRVISDFESFGIPGINPFSGKVRKPIRGRDDDDLTEATY